MTEFIKITLPALLSQFSPHALILFLSLSNRGSQCATLEEALNIGIPK
jgi:hypothetical protein